MGRALLQRQPGRSRPSRRVGVWREGDATITFCLEYDRGTEPLGRISAKAADYERLERAWGIAYWLLFVVPGPRRERGVRAALAGTGLAVATATRAGALASETAVWAPLDAEGSRLRLAELAGWPRPPQSVARVAEAARLRAGEPPSRAGDGRLAIRGEWRPDGRIGTVSIQHSKGRYTYFFCLDQKNDPLGTCREPYAAADDLEAQIEDLYLRIQLPESWAERLREEMAAEMKERQRADAAQRELLTRRLAKAEGQRRKLLDAYYGGAIDVTTLKIEQARIGSAIEAAKERLADLDANLTDQQEILDLAASLATRCGDAYREANDRTRKLFNAAVFERLDVKGGRLCHEQYRPPFDGVFTVSEFEYGTRGRVETTISYSSPAELRDRLMTALAAAD